MYKKKVLALMLAATTAVSVFPVGAFAEATIPTSPMGIQEFFEGNLVDDKTKASIPVEYTVGAAFSVKLPSTITLTDDDGIWDYYGTIGVKGDIDSGKAVGVLPDDSFTMYDVTNRPTEDVPSGDDDQGYARKDPISVVVAQAKTSFARTEIEPEVYTDTELVLDAGAMKSGNWKGLLKVNITYGTSGEIAGLYSSDGTMSKSWSQLKADGIIHVDENGVMTTNYGSSAEVATFSLSDDSATGNLSSGELVGSLVIADEVTALGENALNSCENLTAVIIPASVTKIGASALMGCSGVRSLKFASTAGQWSDVTKGDSWGTGVATDIVSCSDGTAKIMEPAQLIAGNIYTLGGYSWVAAEVKEGYVTLQSKGVTSGYWPGFTMAQFGNSLYYTSDIDGRDISRYNARTTALYNSIKSAEYAGASYGTGLYLISRNMAKPSYAGGNYNQALKTAAGNYRSFGASYSYSWLGTVNSGYYAWFVDSYGNVNSNSGQPNSCVLAPAFNLDTSKVVLNGNALTVLQ
ncbi:MAG: leucine-rich repeat domain-containing protein [Lachnospiraceae bacterium]|nr:leucine-rich repeat domain-containing protein [Lachnospiraceae bacterium]